MADAGVVLAALARRHGAPAWAFLGNVRNGTGFGRKVNRYADALAMSLYPSRGLELHGFEIKVDRGDWLRELKDPDKSAEIQAFCNRWWIAAPPDIVRDGELPVTWGLYVVKGREVRLAKQAPALEAKPLDRPMFAAMLRRATEELTPKAAVEAELEAAVAERLEKRVASNRATAEYERDRAKDDLAALQKSVADFEKRSGIRLDRWNGGSMGKAVELLGHARLDNIVGDLRNALNEAHRHAQNVERTVKALDAARDARPEQEPAGAARADIQRELLWSRSGTPGSFMEPEP